MSRLLAVVVVGALLVGAGAAPAEASGGCGAAEADCSIVGGEVIAHPALEPIPIGTVRLDPGRIPMIDEIELLVDGDQIEPFPGADREPSRQPWWWPILRTLRVGAVPLSAVGVAVAGLSVSGLAGRTRGDRTGLSSRSPAASGTD